MKRPRIAVVGSLNMDLVVSSSRMPKIGETIQGEAIHYIPGGKGANQAVGCARLGADVSMIGAVGDDLFAARMIGDLDQAGVSTERIARLSGVPTGTATILHTPEDNCIVIVSGANGLVTPEMVEAAGSAIEGSDSLLVQLEIPTASVERALRIARAAGVPAVLNPAPARPISDELIAAANYVTPNETEFAALTGSASEDALSDDKTMAEAMREWQRKYRNTIVVTRGERGASFLSGDELITIPAPKVNPVDTTGAGDCLNAALGFGLASGWSLERALTFAVKAASISVTRFGAQAGMPKLAEVAD